APCADSGIWGKRPCLSMKYRCPHHKSFLGRTLPPPSTPAGCVDNRADAFSGSDSRQDRRQSLGPDRIGPPAVHPLRPPRRVDERESRDPLPVLLVPPEGGEQGLRRQP